MTNVNKTTICALTLGVSLTVLCVTASPALADDFYNDQCVSQQGGETWVLSFSTTGDHAIQLWRESGDPRVRTGSYEQNGDDVTAYVEDIRVHLHIASGDAAWQAGDARGTFACRYQGDQRLARWVDVGPSPAPAPACAYTQTCDTHTAPPPASPPSGQMCDMQGTCWSDGGSAHNSLPIRIEGNAAYVAVTLGSMPLEMLIDSGATNTSITDSIAQTLIANGEATLGPDGHVTLADGSTHPSRHILISTVRVGNHELHNIMAMVGGGNASLLLGFDVLSQISGRFSVDATNSRLLFE